MVIGEEAGTGDWTSLSYSHNPLLFIKLTCLTAQDVIPQCWDYRHVPLAQLECMHFRTHETCNSIFPGPPDNEYNMHFST